MSVVGLFYLREAEPQLVRVSLIIEFYQVFLIWMKKHAFVIALCMWCFSWRLFWTWSNCLQSRRSLPRSDVDGSSFRVVQCRNEQNCRPHYVARLLGLFLVHGKFRSMSSRQWSLFGWLFSYITSFPRVPLDGTLLGEYRSKCKIIDLWSWFCFGQSPPVRYWVHFACHSFPAWPR